jgi:hypothetical protein
MPNQPKTRKELLQEIKAPQSRVREDRSQSIEVDELAEMIEGSEALKKDWDKYLNIKNVGNLNTSRPLASSTRGTVGVAKGLADFRGEDMDTSLDSERYSYPDYADDLFESQEELRTNINSFLDEVKRKSPKSFKMFLEDSGLTEGQIKASMSADVQEGEIEEDENFMQYDPLMNPKTLPETIKNTKGSKEFLRRVKKPSDRR